MHTQFKECLQSKYPLKHHPSQTVEHGHHTSYISLGSKCLVSLGDNYYVTGIIIILLVFFMLSTCMCLSINNTACFYPFFELDINKIIPYVFISCFIR